MTTNLERIEYELKLAGYKLEPIDEKESSDEKYVQSIGNCVYEICKLFAEQGHSGLSANITLQLLDELLVKGNTLSCDEIKECGLQSPFEKLKAIIQKISECEE